MEGGDNRRNIFAAISELCRCPRYHGTVKVDNIDHIGRMQCLEVGKSMLAVGFGESHRCIQPIDLSHRDSGLNRRLTAAFASDDGNAVTQFDQSG